MRKTILVTDKESGDKVIIGVESIIKVHKVILYDNKGNAKPACTQISSRSALVDFTYTSETVEEINALINEK